MPPRKTKLYIITRWISTPTSLAPESLVSVGDSFLARKILATDALISGNARRD
jgi:hypothetical protein